MTITKENLQKYAASLFANSKPEESQLKLFELLKYATDHENELDDEAKKMTDKIMETIKEYAKKVIESLPEGVLKLQGARIVDKIEGKHYDIKSAIKVLEGPSLLKLPIIDEFNSAFIELMQNVLDQLYEISKNTMNGPVEFSCFTLMYTCVDELLVAHHLCQHAYSTQAYAHIRTVFEIHDKIELFYTQPKWVDVWMGNDEKTKRHELKPSAVREKIGKKRHDPIYGYFSEIGTHIGFKNIQARALMSTELSEKGHKMFKVKFGGSPQTHHIVFTCSFCLISIIALLLKIGIVFSKYLNVADYEEMIRRSAKIMQGFSSKHMIEWAKTVGLDVKDAETFINNEDIWSYDKFKAKWEDEFNKGKSI